MSPLTTRRPAALVGAGLVLALLAACTSASANPPGPPDAPVPPGPAAPPPVGDYVASIEVVPGDDRPRTTVTGAVFDDTNRNGVREPGEAGVPGDRKSTRLNSSHSGESRMPSSA